MIVIPLIANKQKKQPWPASTLQDGVHYTVREYRLNVNGWSLLIGAAVLIISAIFLGGHFSSLRAEHTERITRMQREGVMTGGFVSALRRNRGDNAKLYLNYTFSADGRLVSGHATLSAKVLRNIKPDDALEIVYLPSNPRENWPAQYWPKEPIPLPVMLVMLIGMASGGVLMVGAVEYQRRLIQFGRVTNARVTEVKSMQKSSKRVHYEFRLLSGGRATGKFDLVKGAPEVGQPIPVVYNREAPSRNGKWPLTFFEAKISSSV